jgi:hypothetical protein
MRNQFLRISLNVKSWKIHWELVPHLIYDIRCIKGTIRYYSGSRVEFSYYGKFQCASNFFTRFWGRKVGCSMCLSNFFIEISVLISVIFTQTVWQQRNWLCVQLCTTYKKLSPVAFVINCYQFRKAGFSNSPCLRMQSFSKVIPAENSINSILCNFKNVIFFSRHRI